MAVHKLAASACRPSRRVSAKKANWEGKQPSRIEREVLDRGKKYKRYIRREKESSRIEFVAGGSFSAEKKCQLYEKRAEHERRVDTASVFLSRS